MSDDSEENQTVERSDESESEERNEIDFPIFYELEEFPKLKILKENCKAINIFFFFFFFFFQINLNQGK